MKLVSRSCGNGVALAANISLPIAIQRAGPNAQRRFVEFFAAHIRNKGTRMAYADAVRRFFDWCEEFGIEISSVSPIIIATYIEQLMASYSVPTVKLHLAAIRSLFDFLVTGQVVPSNPAAAVRGPKHVVHKGKTPVLSASETRKLLDGIDTRKIKGQRDKALIGLLVFSFARVSAAINMNIGDLFWQNRRLWFRLHEKGSKYHEVPAHHHAETYLHDYLDTAGIRDQAKGPLFRTISPRKRLSLRRMDRVDVYRMIQRRAQAVGIETRVCCHTFRATGITAYLENGGLLEHAQKIACHSSVRSTKLYDRTSDAITLDEIEKIRI